MPINTVKSSIRKFLLVNLLIAITITTTLTGLGNYYLDQQDIEEHLDTVMSISALSYQALLGNDYQNRSLENIQRDLNLIPNQIEHLTIPSYLPHISSHTYLDNLHYQAWTSEGALLLRSVHAPQSPLTNLKDGFSDQTIDDEKWRVFTTTNSKTGIKTVLGERFDTRKELGYRLAQDDIYIMLLTFPLSGLLIWIIIGRGLDSLHRVAREVANRAPNRLEPVNLEKVPDEIRPVIDEINGLFQRLNDGFEREKRFAADAAHELRTPLAALKAQAQVALNSQDIHEKNEALHKVIAGVNRSTHVVQQLLTMSKLVPEAQTMQNFDKVRLAKVTRDILALMAPLAIEKNIELEFDAPRQLPTFLGNSTTIGILIRNLVDNAIRYSHEKGLVSVKVYKELDDIVLEVADNGPGIPDKLKSRVFERFFRVVGNKSPGSGLGLGIVQQICHLHHARIILDSPKTGTGLIIKVYFPMESTLSA